jgi:Zn-dependent peptidase ImmA (M78 family)
MKPLRPRYAKIDALVGDLLAQLGARPLPVPIIPIAQAAGAIVRYHDFNNEISGVLVRETGAAAVIGVERRQSVHRQRFTIAHELGHFLLHQGDQVHVDRHFRLNFRSARSATAEDVEEIEANAFAAAILMPEKFLRIDAARLQFDIEDENDVRTLAAKYNVSSQAMAIRLVNMISLRRILI